LNVSVKKQQLPLGPAPFEVSVKFGLRPKTHAATGPTGPGACSSPAYAFLASDDGEEGLWTRYEPNSGDSATQGDAPRELRYTAADAALGKVYATTGADGALHIYENGAWRAEFGGSTLGKPVVNPKTHLVYIPDLSADLVHVFDGATDTFLPSINVARSTFTRSVAVDPTGNRLFIATTGEIEARDLAGNHIYTLSYEGPAEESSIAVNPCNGDLYLFGIGQTKVYNGKDGTLKGTLPFHAMAGAVDPGTNQLFCWSDSTLSAYDLCTGQQQWEHRLVISITDILGLTLDTTNHLVYLAESLTHAAHVYNMATGREADIIHPPGPITSNVAVFDCGGCCRLCCDPCAGATGPTGCTLEGYVYALQATEIGVIDPSTHEEISAIGLNPSIGGLPSLNALAYNPSNGQFYVGTGDGLFVFDAHGIEIDHVLTGVGINRVAYNPAANKIYAGENTPDQALYIFDAGDYSLLNTLAVDVGIDLAVDPVRNQVYASQNDGGPVGISGTTDDISGVFYIPDYGVLLAIDPSRGRLYSVSTSGVVSVIDTGSNVIVDDYALAAGVPLGIAVNPNTNRLYANYGSRIDILDADDGSLLDSTSETGVISNVTVDPVANQIYFYNSEGDTVVLSGADNSYLGSIAMSGVLGFAPGTREACPAPGAACPGIFYAGGGANSMYAASAGQDIAFDPTLIDIGNNVTALDDYHFRVNASGVYEIDVTIAMYTNRGTDYSFNYWILRNGDTNSILASGEWNFIPNQARQTGYNQIFEQLNAGDVISARIAAYASADKYDNYIFRTIAIRKIC
jgi:hypothetical protein